jgi:predicted transcriptional regulator of viral defense system
MSVQRTQVDAERLVALAESRGGVVTRAELRECGLSNATVARWIRAGRLHRIYRGVYALGHRALGITARLHAALLYAGPKAALSHTTASWLWGFWGTEPKRIHLSVATRLPSMPDVCLHHPRTTDATTHNGLSVITPQRTLLDLATQVDHGQLRKALAEAEYLKLVDLDALNALLRRGQPGSTALRKAITAHLPQLARTRSVLEERFLALCEAYALPIPSLNVVVEGFLVDGLWEKSHLVVELDSQGAHGTAIRVGNDHDRDLALRAAGYDVRRYTWHQVTKRRREVAGDLRAALAARG